ncbi:hypothetical protein OVA24_05230 [Luteolibacter sp. SL250]|uniref:hypothetical protein n=1 Tax=Luteolibacter sp. SL250 TaxID=2995170 RepID=UPI00226E0FFD|nr:hypothetical protein [Luteolibacter sp. SL250]WAC20783.1 hypothetical protein OVA24_05230 [Luteolibacter sp. SL250]
MRAAAAGILSAFAWSWGIWAVARVMDLNMDPPEAGIFKSAAHALLVALPIGIAAHSAVEFFRMKTWWIIPVAFGIGVIAAMSLMAVGSPEGQLLNVVALLGTPVAFAIPYCLMLDRRPGDAGTK